MRLSLPANWPNSSRFGTYSRCRKSPRAIASTALSMSATGPTTRPITQYESASAARKIAAAALHTSRRLAAVSSSIDARGSDERTTPTGLPSTSARAAK